MGYFLWADLGSFASVLSAATVSFYRESSRDIDIAILSVCLSVRHLPVFCGNGLTYCYSFFTTHSSFMSIKHLCEIMTGSPPPYGVWGAK